MPQSNPFAYLPPDIQAQLLGHPISSAGVQNALAPMTPDPRSPEYALLVRSGQLAAPRAGTMEYLDFVQTNPGLIESLRKQPGQPNSAAIVPKPIEQPGQPRLFNPFARLSNQLAQ